MEEADSAGLTKDLLTLSCLLTLDPVGVVFETRLTGDTGIDFLVSGTLLRVEEALLTTEGKELLLGSGTGCRTGSEPDTLLVFLPATEPALLCRFSGNPPVLFRLAAAGTAFAVFNDALKVGFITLEVELKPEPEPGPRPGPVFKSNLFLTEPVAAAGFTVFATFFTASDEVAVVEVVVVFFVGIWGFCTGSSSGCANGSSIVKWKSNNKAENLEDVEKLREPRRPYLEVQITVGSE